MENDLTAEITRRRIDVEKLTQEAKFRNATNHKSMYDYTTNINRATLNSSNALIPPPRRYSTRSKKPEDKYQVLQQTNKENLSSSEKANYGDAKELKTRNDPGNWDTSNKESLYEEVGNDCDIYQRNISLVLKNEEQEKQHKIFKENYIEDLTKCEAEMKMLLKNDEALKKENKALKEILKNVDSPSEKGNYYKACFRKLKGEFGFTFETRTDIILLGESKIIIDDIKANHLINIRSCTKSIRKGDFIIMVENVNVTAYDGKNLKDLIQIVFREKEKLDITLAKARWKPTQIDLGGFRNVSEMKKAGLKLELVVTKAPSHGAVDNPQLKDCDVIEKIGDKSVEVFLKEALKQMRKENKITVERFVDVLSIREVSRKDNWNGNHKDPTENHFDDDYANIS